MLVQLDRLVDPVIVVPRECPDSLDPEDPKEKTGRGASQDARDLGEDQDPLELRADLVSMVPREEMETQDPLDLLDQMARKETE